MKSFAARFLSQIIRHSETLETLLRSACRRDVPLCRGIARGYEDVFIDQEWRLADYGEYRLLVNVAEMRGILSYFMNKRLTSFLLPYLITPGDVCIDAGANMGHYTIHMANLTGKSGCVFAFEPQHSFAQMIRQSAKHNNFQHVNVDQRVLYRVSGKELSFFLGRSGNSGIASLNKNFKNGNPRDISGTVSVQTVTLATVFQEQDIDTCQLLKVDVEGAESELLEGAIELLESHRINSVIIETHRGDTAEEILLASDYKGFLIDQTTERLIPLSKIQPGHFGDYFFMSPHMSYPLSGA
jgi:FkbM family methyltransferase